MKLVHAGDLHLGYRAYHRTNPRGINIREADVARAFRELLDRAAELEPDLFLVAGDVFNTVRPSNAAIADAFQQLVRFRQTARGTRVVLIAGNHDSPRAAEMGSILRLFAEIEGVSVVHHEPRRLMFPDLRASVMCLPAPALLVQERLSIEPADEAEHNVLLAHAPPPPDDERFRLALDFGGMPLRTESFDADDWSYVALGHYHIRGRLQSNVCYAGAIERTSHNIWAEADNRRPAPRDDPWKEAAWGKGFVEYDVASGRAEFHTLESVRPVIDLEPILNPPGSAEELNDDVEDKLDSVPGGIEDKIVRLRIFNLPRELYRELDHRRIRDYRTRALHLQLDVRPPEVVRREGSAAPGRRLTLREELESFLKHRWQPQSDKLDRSALIELGLRYLDRAEEEEALEGRE